MKDKYHNQWEKLGKNDPYWAVLTVPSKKGNKWDRTEFFNTGEKAIEKVLLKIKQSGTELTYGTALDFGCGVGRVSRALAKRFEKVIAVDISNTMLTEARKANVRFDNICFLQNTVENLGIIPDRNVDMLYSIMVLQHMPEIRQAIFIKEFCRVLRPGGVLAIQTPSEYNLSKYKGWLYLFAGNKILNILRKIKYGDMGIMEMHTISKNKVLKILSREKMTIICVERLDSVGQAFKSYMYYAIKS